MNKKLQTVDFNLLNSISNNDEDFRNELIKIFLGQIPVFINNMKLFFNDDKLLNLAREAHTAKSSVMIFGMTDTGNLLKEIQTWAETNNISGMEAALLKVETDLNQAQTELQYLLNQG